MTVGVERFENNENSAGSEVRENLLKRKNDLEISLKGVSDEEKITSKRFKEYSTLEALLNMDDSKLLKTIGAGAKKKGVRRVKDVIYKITKIKFGNNNYIEPNEKFNTGPDYFLGTK